MLGTILIGGITKATVANVIATAGATYGLNKFVFKPVEEATKDYVSKKARGMMKDAIKEEMTEMAEIIAKVVVEVNNTMNNKATETPKG